jgi:hypothetical protein
LTASGFARRPVWALSIVLGVLVSLWMSHRSNTLWDYQQDAGPPIDALIHGRIHDFLAARPVMGPLSLVYRAPFAWLGQQLGHGGKANLYLDDYRFGVFACLMVALAFGFALARTMADMGRNAITCVAVTLFAVVNPVSLRAIHFGHPEEIVGSALLAGSMLAALQRRIWLTLVLVALAVLNKQWAVVGLPAVVITLGLAVGWSRLRRPALVVLGLGILATVPLLLVDAHSLIKLTKSMADLRGSYVFPASVWYGITPDLPLREVSFAPIGTHDLPTWLGITARPLILLAGLAIPLALMGRLREDLRKRAFPVLALTMLARCMFDPADNGYYHLPFLLALLGADAFGGRFYATAVASIALAAPTVFKMTPDTLAAFYSLWAPAFAVYLAGRAYGFDWVAWVKNRGVRGQAAAPPAH